MNFKRLALMLLSIGTALPALAWNPVSTCDKGLLEIDRDGNSNTFQIVLRGNVADWIVNQTHLLATMSNARGEVIAQEIADPKYGGYRYFQVFDGKNDGLAVKLSLENYPPRLEAQTYEAKYGKYGPLETYDFNNCQM